MQNQNDDLAEESGLSRRDVATALLSALGVSALSSCAAPAEATLNLGTQASAAVGSSSVVAWVDTVLGAPPTSSRTGDLATNTPSTLGGATIAIAKGCVTPGDGGGGVFYWDPATATDDGGTVIVPNGVSSGHWRRVFSGALNIRWFGAVGNVEPGVSNPQDDTIAIQNALNAAEQLSQSHHHNGIGNTVIIPPGNYKIQPQGSNPYALLITRNVRLLGAGAPPLSGSVLYLYGNGDGILVEGGFAQSTILESICLYPPPGVSYSGRDGIVIHASFVSLINCYVGGMGRHGIIIESGQAGVAGLESSTSLPNGTWVLANLWRITNCRVDTNGTSGIRIHGSDTNGGLALSTYSVGNPIGFDDSSLGGGTWIGCYAEGAGTGFVSQSAGAGTYVGCGSETNPRANFVNKTSVAVGAALTLDANQRVGMNDAALVFNSKGSAEPNFGAQIPILPPGYPGGRIGPIGFWRNFTPSGASLPTTITWLLGYEPSGHAEWKNMYGVQFAGPHQPDAEILDNDVIGCPFGWTDSGHARGTALPAIGNPLLNTQRRWSVKKPGVVLNPGANIVFLSGSGWTYNDSVYWTANPADASPGNQPRYRYAETRLSVEVEITGETTSEIAAALNAADIVVGPHAFSKPYTSDPHVPRNAAVKIYNNGSSAVTATVVFHFEAFVRHTGVLSP